MLDKSFFVKRLVNRKGGYKNGHIQLFLYKPVNGDISSIDMGFYNNVAYVLNFKNINDQILCEEEKYLNGTIDTTCNVYTFSSPIAAYMYYVKLYKELEKLL